jgi:hypothetical protein
MREPTFARLYRRFLALVAQPLPLAGAAAERETCDPGASPLERWIAGGNQERASERLGIYAHMYFARLRASLREDYSACAQVAGDTAFDRVVVRYLLTHPSDNPSLRHHGRHFPEFLRTHGPALAAECGELRPDLADLAALEWARIEAFDAPEAVPLDTPTLAALEPGAWAELEVRLVPSQRIVRSEHEIDALWLAAEHGGVAPSRRPGEQRLLVWRRGFTVYHRVVAGDELGALLLLERPVTFGRLCSAFDQGRPTTEAADRALVVLEQWLADGLLVLSVSSARREAAA